MKSGQTTGSIGNLLCEKGLARRFGLLEFAGRAGGADEASEKNASPAALRLRMDDAVIREVFNARYSPLGLFESHSRVQEAAKRELLLRTLYRLYWAGRAQLPEELWREISRREVEAIVSSLQRLTLVGNPSWERLVSEVERRATQDEDLLAHVMDPFSLRYVLSYHSEASREEIGIENLNTLAAAALRRDAAGIRAWFQALLAQHDSLPKDITQLLRSVMLEVACSGHGDLGTIAFEIATLDVEVSEDLGWESIRAFCAQLRRITAPGCEALDPYCTDEDIDEALTAVESLHQEELVTHFRKLAVSYDVRQHSQLRRKVFVAAGVTIESGSNSRAPMSSHSRAPHSLAAVGLAGALS
ncbi:MAG TPA: hypothetical protein VFT72_07530 [Opitutaceae bacterium]|nr:hypothetical protein [Opitutaceae bacterium]